MPDINTETPKPPPASEATRTPERKVYTVDTALTQLRNNGRAEMQQQTADQDRRYHTLEKHEEPLERRAEPIADVLHMSPEDKKLFKNVAVPNHDREINQQNPAEDAIAAMVSRERGAIGENINLNADPKKGERRNPAPAPGEDQDPNSFGKYGSEAKSATKTRKEMEEMKDEKGNPVFTEKQINDVDLAIKLTYPEAEFGPDFKGKPFKEHARYNEIVQKFPWAGDMIKHLEDKGIDRGPRFFSAHLKRMLENGELVPNVALGMSIVDLAGAGMGDPKPKAGERKGEFMDEGDMEGAESLRNVSNKKNHDALISGKTDKDIADRDKAIGAMTNWLRSQPGFAAHQMLDYLDNAMLLEKNGQFNSQDVENYVKVICGNFQDNIKGAVERYNTVNEKVTKLSETGKGLAVSFLLKEMGMRSDNDDIQQLIATTGEPDAKLLAIAGQQNEAEKSAA